MIVYKRIRMAFLAAIQLYRTGGLLRAGLNRTLHEPEMEDKAEEKDKGTKRLPP